MKSPLPCGLEVSQPPHLSVELHVGRQLLQLPPAVFGSISVVLRGARLSDRGAALGLRGLCLHVPGSLNLRCQSDEP